MTAVPERNKRKYMKKRITAALTAMLMLFTAVSCGRGGSGSETSGGDVTTEPVQTEVVIPAEGLSEYKIIRSADVGTTGKEAALYLRDAIKDKFDVRLQIGDDWVGKDENAGDKEIIVGITNRDNLTSDILLLRGRDWLIGTSAEKIIICGGSEDATMMAVKEFVSTCLGTGESAVSVTEKKTFTAEYQVKKFSIAGAEIPNNGAGFGIVYPDGAAKPLISAAGQIRDFISDCYGVTLPVTSESKAGCEYRIFVGRSANEESGAAKLREKLNEYGYFIFSSGKTITVSGSGTRTTVNGVSAFLERYLGKDPSTGSYKGDGNIALGSTEFLDNNAYTAVDPCKSSGNSADVTVTVKGGKSTGQTVDAVLDTLNQWNFNAGWRGQKPHGYFAENQPFIKYVQFMTATGGSEDRDLFKNPSDTSVLDDYEFDPLVEACRNVVEQGLKPWIKTGNIPRKYSQDYGKIGNFGVNIHQPKDYDVYYNYIAAIAKTLVAEFGLEEVRTWRWGVFTEYENSDWFTATDMSIAKQEYFKIYDYTTEALMSVLGRDIYISAHSMTCSEGIWNELDFIDHCANGTNYCTGKKGAHVSALASSFYDQKPGQFSSVTAADCIKKLRDKAESVGLTGLEYGIDEGRILFGSDGKELSSRTVGWTYQAGYDARLIKSLLDNNIDYFSSWGYTTGDNFSGLKTVSFHVAECFERMVGSVMTKNTVRNDNGTRRFEYDAVTSYNEKENRFYVMGYAFKNEMISDKSANVSFDIELPMFDGREVTVTRYLIDDGANFFDEWRHDYDATGGEGIGWSIDSAQINAPFNPVDYAEYSELVAARGKTMVIGEKITLDTTLKGNAVVFYVIEPAS